MVLRTCIWPPRDTCIPGLWELLARQGCFSFLPLGKGEEKGNKHLWSPEYMPDSYSLQAIVKVFQFYRN